MNRARILKFLPGRPADREAHQLRNPSEALLLLRNFEESSKGWFWSTDQPGRLTYLSESLSLLLGEAGAIRPGADFASLFEPADQMREVRERLPFLFGKRAKFHKLKLRTVKTGDSCWWEVSGCPQFDAAGHFTGYRGYGVDITEQLQSSETASQLAMYDPLTNLPNRLRMSKCLDASLSALDQPGRSCAIILIDLDRFKQVNDSLGHPAGDSLLVQVAQRLLRIVGDFAVQLLENGGKLANPAIEARSHGLASRQHIAPMIGLDRPYMIGQAGKLYLDPERMLGPLARAGLPARQKQGRDRRKDCHHQPGEAE